MSKNNFPRAIFKWIKWPLLGVALVGASGCATSFKYQPRHNQIYAITTMNGGAEITHAEDLRSSDEMQPEWSRKVEVIVARAVADELDYAKLFQRVKIHLSGPLANNRYSRIIELRVEQFRYYNPTNFFDQGREALSWMGVRGALIAASIPRNYVSEVKVEFEVLDAHTRQSLFRKTYADRRSLSANDYEGKSRPIKQTSDALQAVVQGFVADLVKEEQLGQR